MINYSTESLSTLICERLLYDFDDLSKQFQESIHDVGVRYCYIDNLLPNDLVNYIYKVFPNSSNMRLMESFREKKCTSKDFDNFDPILKKITFALQDSSVIELVSKITLIKDQIPDPTLYAGGLSSMNLGHHLGPHIDNSHDASRKYYRTLNLLYYVSPDWNINYGGNLELWDKNVSKNVTIESKFNRLVLMETTPSSWHSVSKVVIDKSRNCVSNYYFSSSSPTQKDYFNVTSFNGRPEQTLLRFFSKYDNFVRQSVRNVFPNGLGKKDIYKGSVNVKK